MAIRESPQTNAPAHDLDDGVVWVRGLGLYLTVELCVEQLLLASHGRSSAGR